jgi:dephospho-CoA kinase
MSKLILGFVGPLASGKDASKKYLEEKYGASSHRFSTMLRDILNRIYVPINRENLQNISFDLRKRFGSDAMAKVIAEDVKNDTNEIVIVDGVRRMADIISLKDVAGFYLISIDAKEEIRYERMKTRNENVGDAKKTFAEFLEDGKKEAELEIPLVMSNARFIINNDGSFENLYKQIDDIIISLKK